MNNVINHFIIIPWEPRKQLPSIHLQKQHDAQQHTQQQPQEQPDPNQQQRIQTFYPSWDDFNHSPSYIEKIIQCICLALLFISTQNWIGQSYSPPEWKHHAQYDFNVEEMVIEKPIEQSFKQLSHEVFEAHNVAKNQLK